MAIVETKEGNMKDLMNDAIIESFIEGYSEDLRDLLNKVKDNRSGSKEDLKDAMEVSSGKTLDLLKKYEKNYRDMLR